VIRSDVIRKNCLPIQPAHPSESGFGRGMYSAYATEVTYKPAVCAGQEDLKKGKSVVIDATFSRAVNREEALRIAAYRQATPVFVECRAAEAILAARLLKRETEPSVSDARLIHLQAFKTIRTHNRIDPEIHILVDTEIPAGGLPSANTADRGLWDGPSERRQACLIELWPQQTWSPPPMRRCIGYPDGPATGRPPLSAACDGVRLDRQSPPGPSF
jgi:predicted kinase